MSKPYDATLKDLTADYPADWLRPLGISVAPVSVIDADLSTVTTQADKVIRVEAQAPFLLHVELQSRYDAGLHRSILKYNALLHARHGLPVHTCVVLLRPEAQTGSLTGLLEYAPVPGGGTRFEYQLVRVWREPVEPFLTGGLGTLPLAPLCDLSEAELPGVVRRMGDRVLAEVSAPSEAARLWAATYVLMGLRYPDALADQLLKGVMGMEESVTYQAIIAEGAARGTIETLRRTVLRQGTERFGEPDEVSRATIQALTDLSRLEALTLRVLRAGSWQDLLRNP